MTATAHALVGGAIAASVQNPALGLSLSAISHPLLDTIPHWDFGWGWRQKSKLLLFTESVFDLSLGFVLAYLLFGQHVNFWYFLACVFVSEVWDILEAPYWFFGWKFFPFGIIYKIQSQMQGRAKTMELGILTQVATVVLIVLVLQIFPKF